MKRASIWSLFEYLPNYRPRAIRAGTFSVINKLFDIAPEILIGAAIDVVVNQKASFFARLGIVDLNQQLILLAGLTFVIWVSESIFEYLYKIEWRNLAQTVQNDLRLKTYDHVQKLDHATFENVQTGHWVSIMNDDVNQLERFLDTGANQILQVATSVVAVGAIFFYISPLIAAFAILPTPLIVLGAFYFQKKAAPRYARVREMAGQLGARLTGNLTGITTIKSFNAESVELDVVRKESEEYRESNRLAIQISSAFIPVVRMGILTGFLATLVIGGLLALDGKLGVGSYGVLVFLTQRLLWPLTSLAETADLYERAMASWQRIRNLLETPITISDKADAKTPTSTVGGVDFDNVNFDYATRPGVLKQINLSIQPHQTTAFVGTTGSGKSTLVKLLLRFYDVSSGSVKLDGTDVRDLPLGFLRGQIGLVSQDVFLFQGSVGENIRYGKPTATNEEVISAAQAAEAHDFIMSLPDGYDTIIGERGLKLSGGQRQRVSLARAILKDPPILVLDEATSAVDNETEAAIQRSLAKVTKNRTTIVIAHRLSTIVNADQIYVIENGEVTDMGTHQKLLNQKGAYANLWNVQTGQTSAPQAQI